jgi:hypothetical protein
MEEPAKSKPNPSRFINNILTYEEIAEEFRKKLEQFLYLQKYYACSNFNCFNVRLVFNKAEKNRK